ncbi:hypothetical protein OTK49_21235 [Vibrio coralliirubri]|uniref:hypothetical protein n=1 Tax=Vibrio coralliirubri TaxID=1516159 RepID=UPI002283544B|nr:hypothetical protein [Vibrio coralliirubri]MCY9865045.1 hypothetical protein [Vibrio coralliirubri]
MKNINLIEQIKTENQNLSKNILDWSEYLILMLSARDCSGHITSLSSYCNPRSFIPDVLKFASFSSMPVRLEIEEAKELKELLHKYGLTTRVYGVEYRGEVHTIDDDELPFYLEAQERINEAHRRHTIGELTQYEYDEILNDSKNKAINPHTGGFISFDAFIATDYFTGLVDADVRFAVVKDTHIVKAAYKLLTPEQIAEIETKAKEIAEIEMVESR